MEKELQEVIALTSTELEEYQEKVLELEDEVRPWAWEPVVRSVPDANWPLVKYCLFIAAGVQVL